MKLPQIQISTQPALIGLRQTLGTQAIKQEHAELNIRQPKANLNIQVKPSRLTIDQSQAWRDMGLIGALEATKRSAQDGYSQLLTFIASKSQEGNQLMKIEHSSSPIASIAKSKSERPIRDINIDWIPSRFAVKTNYQPSEVRVDVKSNKPSISAQRKEPSIHYQPGGAEVFIRQQNNIEINVKV